MIESDMKDKEEKLLNSIEDYLNQEEEEEGEGE